MYRSYRQVENRLRLFYPLLAWMVGSLIASPASATTYPFSQLKTGYFGWGNALVKTAADACQTWPGFFNQPTSGVAWIYQFHSVRSELIQGSVVEVCYNMMIPVVDTVQPIGPNNYGSVAGNFAEVCDKGTVKVDNGCMAVENKTDTCPATAHPVSLVSGEKFLDEVLYRGPGTFPLEFTLRYRSTSPTPQLTNTPSGITVITPIGGRNSNMPFACIPEVPSVQSLMEPPFKAACIPGADVDRLQNPASVAPGMGWRSNLHKGVSMMHDEKRAMVARADGRAYLFTVNASDAWSSSADVNGKLYRLVSPAGMTRGWRYVDPDGTSESYDVIGRLESETSREGKKHIFRYVDQGHLASVEDVHGRSLGFQYDGKHRLIKLIDPDNKITGLEYDAKGNLATITYPGLSSKTFLYEDIRFPHAMTGVIDENGARFITYTYDAQGRVQAEELKDGVSKNTFLYGPGQSWTTVIDAFNTSRTTTFTKLNGVSLVTGQSQPAGAGCMPAGAKSTHDANGNVLTRTDFNGSVSTYTYNTAHNLETSRTEARGTPEARTISTDWDLALRVPLRIAEPKRMTTYTYFPTGSLRSKTTQATSDANGAAGFGAVLVGQPRTLSYTYTETGNLKTVTGPTAGSLEVVVYEYDATGNLTSVTNAAGHKTALSDYDQTGRVGRIVDPNAITTTLKYTPRGWLESRTVTGAAGSTVSTVYTYDGVGQMKSARTSGRGAVYYDYDDAHRLQKISDGLGNEISYTLDKLGNRTVEQVTDSSGALVRSTTRVFDELNRLKQITGGAQ